MALKTSLILDLQGNLQAKAQQNARALESLGKRGQAAMRAMSSAGAAIGKGLDAIGNRYTAFLTGGGLALASKHVMDSSMRFTRLGISADVGADKVKKLQQSIYEAAQAPDIRIDPSELTSAVEQILEKTGDLKFAEDNIRNIGLAIQAAGAEGGAIGDVFAEFQKQGMDSRAAMEALDTLILQGKEGAFTLKDLAALGPRVVTAYTALGRSGPQAMREMGAVLQLIRMGTGSSEEAATSWEAMLRTFTDKSKVKFLQKEGVQVFDPEALKQGKEVLRPANELMVEILKAAKNKATNLSDVFDARAIRAFNAILDEIQRTGKTETLDHLVNLKGDGSTILKDSARAAAEASSAITNLRTAWEQFADSTLTGPIQAMADALNSLGSEKAQAALDVASKIAMAGGALIAARKGQQAYRGLKDMFGVGGAKGPATLGGGRGSGLGGALGGGLGGGLGGLKPPIPVYVVNRHMSLTKDAMMGGSPLPSAGKTTVAGAAGAKTGAAGGKMLARFGRAGAATGALATAGAVMRGVDALMDDTLDTAQKTAAIAESGGQAIGGLAGAAAGAAIGSVVPVVGTAIGGLIGGILGSLGGDWLGKQAAESGVLQQLAEAIKNFGSETVVKIQADGALGATVERHSGPAQVDVYSGPGGHSTLGMY